VTGLDELEAASARANQLWYIAHPVHPTAEEVDDRMRRLRGYVGGSPGDREAREVMVEVIRANLENAKSWLAWLTTRYPEVTFIAPWIAAIESGADDDLVPEQRERGLRDCCRTVSVCCGIIHVGGRVSSGMLAEAAHADHVVDLTYLGRLPPEVDPVIGTDPRCDR